MPSRIASLVVLTLVLTAGASHAQLSADTPAPGSGLASPVATVTDAPSRAPQSIQRFYIDLITRLALRALERAKAA